MCLFKNDKVAVLLLVIMSPTDILHLKIEDLYYRWLRGSDPWEMGVLLLIPPPVDPPLGYVDHLSMELIPVTIETLTADLLMDIYKLPVIVSSTGLSIYSKERT